MQSPYFRAATTMVATLSFLFSMSTCPRAHGDEPGQTPPADSQPADPAAVESEEAAASAAEPRDQSPFVLDQERWSGDWWGARPWLEERGITVDLGLTNIYQHNAHGGLQTKNAHRVSGSYDLELTFDTAAMKLWPDGVFYIYSEGNWEDGVSKYVGDLFGVNYDTYLGNTPFNISELWYEHSFFDSRLRVRLGKLDSTVDFDTNSFANDETSQFLNSALVNNATIPFTDYGHGLELVATPVEWFYFAAGVFDADAVATRDGFHTAYHGPRNFLNLYEFGFTPEIDVGCCKLPGSYRFGLWYDPQPKEMFFDDLDGRRRTIPMKRDDVGFYVSFDQLVFRENPGPDPDDQGMGLFFRYGYAPGDVNEIQNFWSVGGQYRGLIPTRDEDVLGIGAAQGLLSERMRLADADPHRETVIEAYYSVQVLPWLTVSPDFQWVLRPGGENGRDAFVAGLRVQMSF